VSDGAAHRSIADLVAALLKRISKKVAPAIFVSQLPHRRADGS
jgi:hypothetical protein